MLAPCKKLSMAMHGYYKRKMGSFWFCERPCLRVRREWQRKSPEVLLWLHSWVSAHLHTHGHATHTCTHTNIHTHAYTHSHKHTPENKQTKKNLEPN